MIITYNDNDELTEKALATCSHDSRMLYNETITEYNHLCRQKDKCHCLKQFLKTINHSVFSFYYCYEHNIIDFKHNALHKSMFYLLRENPSC